MYPSGDSLGASTSILEVEDELSSDNLSSCCDFVASNRES